MMIPRIRCAICGHSVDNVTVFYQPWDRRHVIRVECHGDNDTMDLTVDQAIDRDLVDQLYAQEGVAFTTPRLA